MSDTLEPADEPPIILRKKIRMPEEPHGGAWKVAYADFVTAMMAFFLLLWLLNVTTEDKKQGISDFFEPVGVSKEQTGSGSVLKGLAMDAQGALRSAGSPPRITVAIPTFGSKDTGSSEGKNDSPAVVGGGYTDGIDQRHVDDAEDQEFKKVIAALRQAVLESPELAQMQDNLMLEQTPDGLLIQILDRVKVRVFSGHGAAMTERGKHLIAIIASIVGRMPNKILITGHTDGWDASQPEAARKWEISGNRADAARLVLLAFGVGKARFSRVVGKADREPIQPGVPKAERNNRISILLMREDHPDLRVGGPAPQPKG
ncbi:MAG: flagellar motor protein MotB [Alphaproteobacteria bacterium]